MSQMLVAALSLSAAFANADRLMTFEDKLTTYNDALQLCSKHGGHLIREADLNGVSFPNQTSAHDDPFQFWISKSNFIALEAEDEFLLDGSLPSSMPTTSAKPGASTGDASMHGMSLEQNRPNTQNSSPLAPSGATPQGDDSNTDLHDDRLKNQVHKPSQNDDDDDDKSPVGDDSNTDPQDDRLKNKVHNKPKPSKDGNTSPSEKSAGDLRKSQPAAADDDDDDDDDDPQNSKTSKPNSDDRQKEATISKDKKDMQPHKQDLSDEADDGRVGGRRSSPDSKSKSARKPEITIRKMSKKERSSKKEMIDAVRQQKVQNPEAKISQSKLPDAGKTADDFMSSKIPSPSGGSKSSETGTTMLESGRVSPQPPSQPQMTTPQASSTNATMPAAGPPAPNTTPAYGRVPFPASQVQNAIVSGMISPTTPLVIIPAAMPANESAPAPSSANTPAPAPSAVDSINSGDASFRPAVPKPVGFGFQTLSVNDPQVPDCITYLAGKRFRSFCTEVHIPVCIIPSP